MRGREREEREAAVALSRETAPSLETGDGGEDAVRPRGRGGGGGGGEPPVMWIPERIPLARNRTLMLISSIPLLLFFVSGRGEKINLRRGRGITFVSYSGARREEWPIWRGGNEAAVNLFLIDQSLSKGKGKRGKENKHSEMLIWNRHFREQIRLSNYHLCLRMTPLM